MTHNAISPAKSMAASATSKAGFAEADVIHEGSYFTPRTQHAHLETHAAIGWVDEQRDAGTCVPARRCRS